MTLSAAESFEYLELAGVACSLDCRGSGEAPKAQLLAAYRLFQRLLEANWDRIHACRLELMPEEGMLMRLALDSPELRGAEGAPAPGLALETRLEDDTWLVTLRAPAGTLAGREAEA